jgi:cbb3-type cytochrome oxidase maturation protein
MRILIILIPISLALLGAALWAFIWAVRRGQFDDLDTPAIDMLADAPSPLPKPGVSASAPHSVEQPPQ